MAADETKGEERSIRAALGESLGELKLGAADQAVSRLACIYAEQLDRAAGAAAHAEKVLKLISTDDEPDLAELIGALKAKLAERVTVAEIGPKLLAALESMGATPKARAAVAGKGVTPNAGSARSTLDELRARRVARSDGTATLDTATS